MRPLGSTSRVIRAMKTDRKLRSGSSRKAKVAYAVVGLGHIAQHAVLPAFAHARENSELVALVSSDPVKLKKLSREYKVPETYSYDEYEACLHRGTVDAVYIALPNSMHRDFTVRAAAAGVHVLCEKPLAVTEEECLEMIQACSEHQVKLMAAYRLHLDPGNLEAVRIVQSGKLGEARIFNSLFPLQLKAGNIRLKKSLGGGTLYDIGIYCINASRYLFQAEPTEGVAFSANSGEKRFAQVDEMTSAILRFPGDRLASFTSSFGAEGTADFEVLGTKGSLRGINPYDYEGEMTLEWTAGGKRGSLRRPAEDQFAAELDYFSNCVLKNLEPEPSGEEGLADVHIIRRLYESARRGEPVEFEVGQRHRRPTPRQKRRHPPVQSTRLVHTAAPSR